MLTDAVDFVNKFNIKLERIGKGTNLVGLIYSNEKLILLLVNGVGLIELKIKSSVYPERSYNTIAAM